jgi:hypothetical protein
MEIYTGVIMREMERNQDRDFKMSSRILKTRQGMIIVLDSE